MEKVQNPDLHQWVESVRKVFIKCAWRGYIKCAKCVRYYAGKVHTRKPCARKVRASQPSVQKVPIPKPSAQKVQAPKLRVQKVCAPTSSMQKVREKCILQYCELG